ncbi:hypothetical protein N431DRAFT_478585 [Stipitochalara longipes BDJ]|nr:hypothetical protein N431DRAFT_478585 [Stipitochalara longipes BDJ]
MSAIPGQTIQRSLVKKPLGKRHATACTECRRRKQKCDQARDKPCNHCARRYPPPLCVYESDKWQPSTVPAILSQISLQGRTAEQKEKHLEGASNLLQSESDIVSSKLLHRIWRSTEACSPTIGSGTAVDDLQFLPIEPTKRNAELLYCFHQTLGQYIATIDGKDPPVEFKKMFISRVIQSPLAANIPLHSTSCYQAALRGLEVQKCTEVITIESHTMSLIRKYIEGKPKGLQVDAILTVFLLVENEWHWCDDDYKLRAHMKGLKEMLRLVGGIESATMDLWIRRHIILADYQIACCTEKELFLLESQTEGQDLLALSPALVSFDNPLYTSNTRLEDFVEFKDLGPSTLKILDDMKFLTASLLVAQPALATPKAIAKFEATALWTYDRVAALPSIPAMLFNSSEDLIYETIRLTALLYCKAITSHALLSKNCEPVICISLWQTMWLVNMSRWKQIPGIFLWVMLVACTSLKYKAQRLFLNMNIWTVTLHIGLSSHEVAVGCLDTFLRVQRWIKESEKA